MRLASRAHADRIRSAQSAGGILALLVLAASLTPMSSAAAQTTVCSVFDNRPCAPTTCSVFNDGPCVPDLPYPFSQDLWLTMQSRPETRRPPPSGEALNTLQQLFAAMEACWEPPPLEQSRPGTEITIRFSLNRSGDIIGEPRFTYSTPSLPPEIKAAYQRALAAMVKRCTPFKLSPGLGGAIAGRPISTRFIDDRGQRRTEMRHE
jgi:hypothetical protein